MNPRDDIEFTFPPPLGPTRATFEPGCSFNVIPYRQQNPVYLVIIMYHPIWMTRQFITPEQKMVP